MKVNLRTQKTVQIKAYEIDGIAFIRLWRGEYRYIKMTRKVVDDPNDIEQVKSAINDRCFGCEEILGGYVMCWERDENGGLEWVGDEELIIFDEKNRKICEKLREDYINSEDY